MSEQYTCDDYRLAGRQIVTAVEELKAAVAEENLARAGVQLENILRAARELSAECIDNGN